ncbi:MAG: imelysin family protein [Pseudomonadota bacterium]
MQHILPGFTVLEQETAKLAATAGANCTPEAPELREGYHAAFDAWVAVSHLRFGPSEQDDRAFALAFWPDPRGSTPGTLAGLIRSADPVVETSEGFQQVSIAGRGFYALEFLLYDPQFANADAEYLCALIQAVANDIALNSAEISSEWRTTYAALMVDANNDTYRSDNEAVRQLFTALATGLEFTSQARLGRPMGTFERPRPNRAEARRSGRSLRHVSLSLAATRDLANSLSESDAELDALFAKAINQAGDLDDPAFANVATQQGRFRVEALQSSIEDIRRYVSGTLAPRLGIEAGFNSLDGD